MSEAVHRGGCNCGAVRFETRGAPKFIVRCHCEGCRRATGGAFSTWVGFADAQCAWLSAPRFFESSQGVKRGFCANCGAPLTYQGEKWPGETHFLIGAFDDPSPFTPTGDVFEKEALAWCAPTGEA